MKIILTADSTADIPKKLQEENNIVVCPLIVNLGDEDFLDDGKSITNEKIFEYVEKTGVLPKTSAVSTYSYAEFFKNVFNKYKADKIIHFSLSSKLSSTCENAIKAANELGNIEIIDTQSLSTGSGLLVLSASDKIKQGKTFEEIVKEIHNEINKVQASFVIDNLNYLHKGGRCSAVAVFGANFLRIKPKIKLFNGKMIVDKKYMGKYEQVVEKYVNDILNEYKNPILDRVFITYTTENDLLVKSIKQKLNDRGFKNIINNIAGSTITSHCGKNTLGVLFINND